MPALEPLETGIEGVRILPLETHEDERGSLTEIFRAAWASSADPVAQANLSVSRPGVLRGLHFHREQTDYWFVLEGEAFVGLVDLRRGSPTHLRKVEIRIDAAVDRPGLLIPPGVAHGFLAITEVRLLYVVDRAYDGSDESGVAWDDPDIAISWPSDTPTLSQRDRGNPSLTAILTDAP